MQQGLLNLEEVPWFWHRDLMILDAAMLSPSAEEMDKLWTAISDGAWALKFKLQKYLVIKIHPQNGRIFMGKPFASVLDIWQEISTFGTKLEATS